MSRPTPGPWRWGQNRFEEDTLLGPDGKSLLSILESGASVHVTASEDVDGRLMVAAPEMLDMLQSIALDRNSIPLADIIALLNRVYIEGRE